MIDRLLSPLPLIVVAVGAGLVWPSETLASHTDLVLGVLVLAVALTIDPARLRDAASARAQLAAVVVLPLVTLLPLALLMGLAFATAEREGLLALGLASTEIAAVGLVALAGGNAARALLIAVLSLILTAIAAPLIAPLVSDSAVSSTELLVRFGLVVIVPLAVGMVARASLGSRRLERHADRAAAIALAVLVFASLGDLGSPSEIAAPLAASALFLAGTCIVSIPLWHALGGSSGGLTFAMRDFAVAAALASQLATPGSQATPAVYGVLMLLTGTTLATATRRRAAAAPRAPLTDTKVS